MNRGMYFSLGLFLACGTAVMAGPGTGPVALERIAYKLSPLGGLAEYIDFGVVDLEGRKVNKTIFHTHTLGFEDTETIYSSLENSLPVRVERRILRLIGGEYIVEEYDQARFTVTITKYKGERKVGEQVFKAEGPIHNAVLMMFCARKIFEFQPEWHQVFWVPKRFEVTLASVDKIKIRGRVYEAYHFTSQPDTFELWINKEEPRIPLQIKGKGDFNYKFTLKEYDQDNGHSEN